MTQYANLDEFFQEIENDIKYKEESDRLLRIVLHTLNSIPNTKVHHPDVKSTYELASMIGKHLKNEE